MAQHPRDKHKASPLVLDLPLVLAAPCFPVKSPKRVNKTHMGGRKLQEKHLDLCAFVIQR